MTEQSPKTAQSPLWELGYATLQELETDRGILASGKDEIFGCIFGRDSLITSLDLLKTYERSGDRSLLPLVEKILLNLAMLQGRSVNIESGEEPGKCIHEFRPKDHERLTKAMANPWYVYPDNAMRNYDTVDATPLFLIATYEYYRLTKDGAFFRAMLPSVKSALRWVMNYGDSNADGFIDYRFHPNRTYGGLRTQSWMDSSESLFSADGGEVAYPIAPVEVQAYTYVALRMWSSQLRFMFPRLSKQFALKADSLKKNFNEKFVSEDKTGAIGLAFAIDGNGRQLTDARSSMGHVLWAVYKPAGGVPDGILKKMYIPKIVERLLAPDLFEPQAGIRTLSARSTHFNPKSYHNGSIWPHDTAMFVEGLENYGYHGEAAEARRALMLAYEHFKTPIELFVYEDGRFDEYRSPSGQTACKKQAWSAAALLMESFGV